MPELMYNWNRFWYPRGESIQLSADGYLWDPDDRHGSIYNPHVISLSSISDTPCLILLGEPGMGKSFALRSEYEQAQATGDKASLFDLRRYSSEDRLARDIFGSRDLQEWVQGEHTLHLFLDSLDEGLLRIETISELIADEIKQYPRERLRLRLACRSAVWPLTFEKELAALWPTDSVKTYVLAPLRQTDVAVAAKRHRVDPDSFLGDVAHANAIPLAVRPVTLDLLLASYEHDGSLPATRNALYESGCSRLCEETKLSHRERDTLSPQQRLEVAARIAVVTIFANRHTVRLGTTTVADEPGNLTLADLSGEQEVAQGVAFPVTDDAIRETLDTGLFSSRGQDQLGWAHHTYAEFLAAWYLKQHNLSLEQAMSLLSHPDGKLVPQLHETAAWLAGMRPDVFHRLIDTEPAVLLYSDIVSLENSDRAALTKSLLSAYATGTLLFNGWGHYSRYAALANTSLAEQLRPYIAGPNMNNHVRVAAIEIASACQAHELAGLLVQVALDESEPVHERARAAQAVALAGDAVAIPQLRPLAMGEAGDDPDDELKGSALLALWPKHLSTTDLFAALTPPKNSSLFGAYQSFLHLSPACKIEPGDLPQALNWVKQHGLGDHTLTTFDDLVDDVLVHAWEHLETPGVLDALAEVAVLRIKEGAGLIEGKQRERFGQSLQDHTEKRRLLLAAMVRALATLGVDWSYLAISRVSLLLSEDFWWLLTNLEIARTDDVKQIWAGLVSYCYDMQRVDQTDAVITACAKHEQLPERFQWLLTSIRWPSPEADKAKALHEQRLERPMPALLDPPPIERVHILLGRYDEGDLSAWWRLNLEMTLKPDSEFYGNEFAADLTRLPVWAQLDGTDRNRLVSAAHTYLMKQDPDVEAWISTNTLHRPAFAGYRALLLLANKAPDVLDGLSPEIWARWAPVILAYPTSNEPAERGPQRTLVAKAYAFAASAVVDALVRLIEKESAEDAGVTVLDKLGCCWDERISHTVIGALLQPNVTCRSLGLMLDALVLHDRDEAMKVISPLLGELTTKDEGWHQRAMAAAASLLIHAPTDGWPLLWPMIKSNPEMGRSLLLRSYHASPISVDSFASHLCEDQLADLLLWTYAHDAASEAKVPNAGWSDDRNDLSWLRDGIIMHLAKCGTPAACAALKRLSDAHPDSWSLQYAAYEAAELTRRKTWQPLSPAQILRLVRLPDARVVESADHLLNLVIESLKRMERDLHGETPTVRRLWNYPSQGSKNPRTTIHPKDELTLSDEVKTHLTQDLKGRGITINREVEIRRGQEVDVHVEAFIRGRQGEHLNPIKVIIEVKGSWNPDLKTDMKAQLAGRYLADNPECHHGIYLVGWFNCSSWSEDSNKARATRHFPSISKAREYLQDQANQLSQNGLRLHAFVMDTSFPSEERNAKKS